MLFLSRKQEAKADSRFTEVPPTYFFEMRHSIDRHLLGSITLRIAHADQPFIATNGHIGYFVKPKYRGKKLAARACKLLLPLAKQHGLEEIVIICDSSNVASCRTCELCGGVEEDILTEINSKAVTRKRFRVALTETNKF